MTFVFGDCVVDPDRRELTRGLEKIALAPKVFDLIVFLLTNSDRVVGREMLLDAVWAGKAVSDSTLASHINAARKAIGDSGREQRLIRTVARKGFRFIGDATERSGVDEPTQQRAGARSPDAGATQPLALPDRPSIAALPFVNLSKDADDDYFADGIVEDIILALSRIRWLFVIARNSSFTYKGRAVDVRQVGRELGVRYVLEGSVRKIGAKVRITGQLVDATTGTHLWGERFEGTFEDIFALQDQFAASVVGAVAPQLEFAEIERSKQKPTERLDAYGYYLRGLAKFHLATKSGIDEALALFYKSIEIDPDFASAYGMAAGCYYWLKMNRWLKDRRVDGDEAGRLASRAVKLGKNDAVALTRGGHAWPHFGGDLETCRAYVDRALVLNPNLSTIWYLGGYQRVSMGEHDDAIAYFLRAMRLSPLDPEIFQMWTGIAMSHMYCGRFDEAVSCLEKASQEEPNILRVAAFSAAAHALAGRMTEARRAMVEVRRLDPTLRVGNLDDWLLVRRPQDFEMAVDGLRLAGLPD
jgi:TolB-like protein/Flp pilus assembly protein TadD